MQMDSQNSRPPGGPVDWGMILRAPVMADATAIGGLLSELGYAADEPTVTARLTAFAGRTDHLVVVAEADGSLVGLGVAHVFDVIHTEGPVALITALVVGGSARGSGVGRAIVGRLEQFGLECGCKRILVNTANHRGDAHAFYERLGFGFTGRRYVKGLGGG